jgi:NADH-quinone oxidoreductase subunit L
MGLVAVLFTGFYTFRMVLLTFHGEPRTETARNPHGVRWNVKAPLVVLGVLAATTGLLNMVPVHELLGFPPEYLHDWFAHDGGRAAFSGLTSEHYGDLLPYSSADVSSVVAGAVSLAVALTGAGAAVALYGGADPEEHTARLGAVGTVLYNNYYQDEYQVWLAESVVQPVARAMDALDQGVVDGAVNAVSSVSLFSGRRLRRIQTGVVTNYAALLTLGLTVLVLVAAVMGGWFA